MNDEVTECLVVGAEAGVEKAKQRIVAEADETVR